MPLPRLAAALRRAVIRPAEQFVVQRSPRVGRRYTVHRPLPTSELVRSKGDLCVYICVCASARSAVMLSMLSSLMLLTLLALIFSLYTSFPVLYFGFLAFLLPPFGAHK